MKLRPIVKKEHKEKKEKKERRNLIIAGAIMIFLMIFSTVAYALLNGQFNDSQKVAYNGFEFNYNNENNVWQTTTKISGETKIIDAYFLPSELDNLTDNFNGNIFLSDFENKIVYFSINNTNNERTATSLIASNLGGYAVRFQFVCSPETELTNAGFCSTLPIKSCSDVENSSGILLIELNEILDEKNISEAVYKNNCLSIKATKEDLIKMAQIVVFKSYSIMK